MPVTINPFVNASVVSKPQPHSDTGSRRWASGGTLRQAGSNGSPFEALPRLLQLPPSARMVVGSHLQSATTGRWPLLPLLMFLFVSFVDSGSSPSSASCPASPLPSPSTPRTRSPATSSVPSPPPSLPFSAASSELPAGSDAFSFLLVKRRPADLRDS